jgi:predicted AAA+ superfamily ATPase
LFENFVVVEALKRRYNEGKESNIYFYRDSNQNEVDLLIKENSGISAIEIKSSMTYNTDFEKSLRHIDGWINEPVLNKTIIYAGSLENTAGDVKLLNYKNINNGQ